MFTTSYPRMGAFVCDSAQLPISGNHPPHPLIFEPLTQSTLEKCLNRIQDDLDAPQLDVLAAYTSAAHGPQLTYTNRIGHISFGNVFCIGHANEVVAWLCVGFGRIEVVHDTPVGGEPC